VILLHSVKTYHCDRAIVVFRLRCAYRIVIEIDPWPRYFETTAMGTPAMTQREAAVCLIADFQVKFTSPWLRAHAAGTS